MQAQRGEAAGPRPHSKGVAGWLGGRLTLCPMHGLEGRPLNPSRTRTHCEVLRMKREKSLEGSGQAGATISRVGHTRSALTRKTWLGFWLGQERPLPEQKSGPGSPG